jgi:predicted GH43/DUF377 family glycosyl hydrolase
MWYNGYDGQTYRIIAATSSNGLNWSKLGVVLDVGPPGSTDAYSVVYPDVLFASGTYVMWYTGLSGPTGPISAIMRAVSTNGLNWTKQGVVLGRGVPGSPDSQSAWAPDVSRVGSTYEMMYSGTSDDGTPRLLYAESSDGIAWQKTGIALESLAPIERLISSPSFVVEADGSWSVWYAVRAGTSDIQIYAAVSSIRPPTGAAPAAPDGLRILAGATAAAILGGIVLAGWLWSRRRPEPHAPRC